VKIDVDVLVLGSGIAGLSYALKASDYGRVALVTKKSDTESNTNYAQGGIASVVSEDDTFESHIEDTMVAGAYLCHQDSVEILVKEGPKRIAELIDLGVRFTMERNDSGNLQLALGREGGHSRRRILHSADLTGREIERALVAQLKSRFNAKLFEHNIAIDLIVDEENGRKVCRGAYVLDEETGDVTTVCARVVMLATGGLGRVYQYTTNPEIATGDGVAMAYRIGANVGNMEFIQFHPTSLYHPEARSFLISEAVRGEGGILRLKDVVARAIDSELKKSGEECVYLDVTHLDPEKIKARFPNIYEKCLSVGIDITKDWIPIVPAAHYSCGGVMTDVNGRTSIDRLYACGEVACTGVHGANRLASNSLLEAVVFADRAARDSKPLLDDSSEPVSCATYDTDSHRESVSNELVAELTERVRSIMWRYVGIVRTNQRLQKALDQVKAIEEVAEDLYENGKLSPQLIELRNTALVAELIIRSSLSRKESRGLNYNLDYPEAREEEKHDTVLVKD
jgi:L-aspartate oxidase